MKVFTKNWPTNKTKQFRLHSLLRIYILVMIVVISSFALMLSYADWDGREKEANRVAQRVLARTVNEVEYYYRESARLAQSLVENQARIEGIYKYFSLSTPDYFYWQLERKASPYISVSIYENIDDLYVRNDFVTGVAIVLQDSTEVFVSRRDNRSGEKVSAEDFKPDANSFAIPVSDPVSDQALGVIYISLPPEVLYKAIDNTRGTVPIAVTITSPFETDMFHLGQKGPDEDWLVGITSHAYQVQVAVPKDYVLKGSLTSSGLILGLSALFVFILYLTLKRTFSDYQDQVVDLVDSLEAIAMGEQTKRVDTSKKDQELLLIAETTNDMLDRLEKNIHDIYQLELSQKDANMRALQAQINPHFMYNTLEMIKYMIVQDGRAAGKIIEKFTKILRYSISSTEREILLAEDLNYIQDYIAIQEERFKERFKCSFKISEEAKNLKVMKLALQPIIENSIKYGFKKSMYLNVNIMGEKKENYLVLTVIDDGGGMEEEALEKLKEEIKESEVRGTHNGIHNIARRLELKYKGKSGLSIANTENGFCVTLYIKQEEENV